MIRTTLVLAALLLAAACAEPDSGGDAGAGRNSLEGTWALVSGSGPEGPIEPTADHPVTLDVAGEEASGRSGCNSYTARVVDEGDGWSFADAGGTEMGCAPDVMTLESRYLAALVSVDEHRFRDGGRALVLTGPGTELRFRAG